MRFNSSIAELIGIMLGDGCLSTYQNKYIIYICGHKIDDLDYHTQTTQRLFLQIFNKNVKINFRKKEKTLFLRFSDKSIFNTFVKFGIPIGKKYGHLKIPLWIKKNNSFVFAFLRGLVDTDGCIIFSKQHRKIHYYPRIEITSKSKDFLMEILDFLENLNFYGSVSNKGKGYRLEIPGFQNLKMWLKNIGFDNPKHIKKIEAQLGPLRPRPDLNW